MSIDELNILGCIYFADYYVQSITHLYRVFITASYLQSMFLKEFTVVVPQSRSLKIEASQLQSTATFQPSSYPRFRALRANLRPQFQLPNGSGTNQTLGDEFSKSRFRVPKPGESRNQRHIVSNIHTVKTHDQELIKSNVIESSISTSSSVQFIDQETVCNLQFRQCHDYHDARVSNIYHAYCIPPLGS